MKKKGLSKIEVKKRLEKFGLNILPKKEKDPLWKKFFREFNDLMVIILIIAAIIAFLLGEKIDASIIFFIVILNALIGFFQEWKSEKTLEALEKMVSKMSTVIRDGEEKEINAKYLVPDDIIIIREGDRIPADSKIIKSNSIKIEESALTGESVPIDKEIDDKIFLGTTSVFGSCIAKVTKTGKDSKFGNIANLATKTKSTKSPLEKEINTIGIFVSKITIIIVVLIFLLGFFIKHSGISESFLFAVSVAVAAVPEGLPATITIALALGMQALARKNAVVRKLSSVETLGATTVICSDKTGTLTKNEMTGREGFLSSGEIFKLSGMGWSDKGEILINDDAETNFLDFIEIGKNCNDASIKRKNKNKFEIFGDPTEAAILIIAKKFKKTFKKNIPTLEILKEFPFSSKRKMMSCICKKNSKKILLVKGAPGKILENSSHYFDGKKIVKMTKEAEENFKKKIVKMNEKALRVLAFAKKTISKIPKNSETAEKNLVFYGAFGMIDPARKHVNHAIKSAHDAGIRTIIITGDNPNTAEAIAEDINFFRNKKHRFIFTKDDIDKMSDIKLTHKLFKKVHSRKKNLYYDIIFARVAPEDKMRIVKLLQKKGEIVSVTGDGVNDAPALKKSDIGVSMGISGTEVAQEASNMVLMDDSFVTIVLAISEGRRIFDNIKKFLWFIFSCNIGELIVIITALILAVPSPLSAVLILLIDLGTDILPAIALSLENKEKNIMKQNPRNPKERIMKKTFILNFLKTGIVLGVSTLSSYFYILFSEGWNFGSEIDTHLYTKASTIAFSVLVIAQLFNAFSAKSFTQSAFSNLFDNKYLLGAVAISIMLVLAIVFLPIANKLFGTTPLNITEIITVILFSSIVFIEEEIFKLFYRLKKRQ